MSIVRATGRLSLWPFRTSATEPLVWWSMTTEREIATALRNLGLSGASAEVHSSLRSFGEVEGGAAAAARALSETLENIVVPAFCWDAVVAPPEGDHVERNAPPHESDWKPEKPPRPFDPATSPIAKDNGAISRAVAALPGAARSAHPLMSWAAWGRDAARLVGDYPWDQPCAPVGRLSDLGGHALLLGTTLTTLTAVHLAEEMAGRKMFIRWALGGDGGTIRVRVGGCSDGFDRMLPGVRALFMSGKVGDCAVLAAPLGPLLDRLARTIREEPEITMCERRCERCVAAVAGGPIERY